MRGPVAIFFLLGDPRISSVLYRLCYTILLTSVHMFPLSPVSTRQPLAGCRFPARLPARVICLFIEISLGERRESLVTYMGVCLERLIDSERARWPLFVVCARTGVGMDVGVGWLYLDVMDGWGGDDYIYTLNNWR